MAIDEKAKDMKSPFLLITVMLFGFLLFGCTQQQQSSLREQEARAFVNDDLNAKFPDAQIKEIVEMNPSDGSWQVKARVTYNYSSKCPVRMNVYYDYPKKGFIATPPEYVTRDCTVCKGTTSCVIGTPEEAIIASHTLSGSEMVNNYITAHSGATPDAKFYTEYVDPDNKTKYRDVWVVKWVSTTTNFGIFTIISNTAEIVKSWEVTKSEIL